MKPKRTILCVDDNEQSLSIRKVMLETRGYRVVTCKDGSEALERFKKGDVDLVLTDLVMPGVDGGKLIDAIKALSPETPAILLSGKVRIYDRDTRADVFLPKGMYAPAELLERIRMLLVRKRGPKRAQSKPSRAVGEWARLRENRKTTKDTKVSRRKILRDVPYVILRVLRGLLGSHSAPPPARLPQASCNIDQLDACLY